ncbi:MAG: hypothetical protein KatS3mg038_1142 [Candidatus Kapaibacterium sp.]|nr:MAG: hypothetical protein KatS3mg038_1142 [Candidatus Kapabacteria bacterium]
MPLERYDIAPHTIMPKHLLRERTGTMLVNMDSSVPTTAPNETWTVDVCADEPHALSGLASVDGVTISQLSAVLYAGDGNIYQPQSGAWLQHAVQPSVGDVVLVKHGTKHAGTLHLVTLDDNGARGDVHHSTAIATGLIAPVTVTTTPTPIGCATAVIADPALELNPLQYVCRPHRAGLYALDALLHYTVVGAVSGSVRLHLYINDDDVCMLDINMLGIGYVHMQGSTIVRLAAGDVVDLRLVTDTNHSIGGAILPASARVTITRIG